MNNLYDYFEKNTKGNDYVVGDIHGAYEKLQYALTRLGFDPENDRLFGVGDLIDRGDDSESCLNLLNESWFNSALGNHEDMMIKALCPSTGDLLYHNSGLWLQNGGSWFKHVDDTQDNPTKRFDLLQLAKKLPYMIEVTTDNGSIGICHADFIKKCSWMEAVETIESENFNFEYEDLIWSRRTITQHNSKHDYEISPVSGLTAIVHGHTPCPSAVVVENRYFIDTGAVWDDGHFTFLQIQPEIKIIEVK